MTDRALRAYYRANTDRYQMLASECGSVAELIFKIEIIGNKWTAYDWAMFICFVGATVPTADTMQSDGRFVIDMLRDDILETVDNGTHLDSIFTNKTVMLSIIDSISHNIFYNNIWSLRLLAHVFRKFPDLWKISWMTIRHRNGKKSHRLDFTLYRSYGNTVNGISLEESRLEFIDFQLRKDNHL